MNFGQNSVPKFEEYPEKLSVESNHEHNKDNFKDMQLREAEFAGFEDVWLHHSFSRKSKTLSPLCLAISELFRNEKPILTKIYYWYVTQKIILPMWLDIILQFLSIQINLVFNRQ